LPDCQCDKMLPMFADRSADLVCGFVNGVTAANIEEILLANGWLAASPGNSDDAGLQQWLARAAELLGSYAKNRFELEPLLKPIFVYDAAVVLQDSANQAALAREGAREVIRAFANQLVDGVEIDSDSFKQVIENIKALVPYRSRDMFHPIRLVLTGRTGEGELDRIILLLDAASKLRFSVPVKGAGQRVLEFCCAFD
jgi:glutamyl/glutaminyl-tRNA synthetase